MKIADLHTHTQLSPCASLEMSPQAIVKQAKKRHIDILGISDHNTTRQVALVKKLAEKEGIYVLQGVEINTKEEVHCLCFFPSAKELNTFQKYIDQHLPHIQNRPDLFGDQVQVNEAEEIVYEEKLFLLGALNQSIEEVENKVHHLNGLFIPAHINRKHYGLCHQLGFVPPWLNYDALEIHPAMPLVSELPDNGVRILYNSDAHHPDEIGQRSNKMDIEVCSWEHIYQWINAWKSP